ncbi:putative NADH-flavin reductase [Litorivivens lipolytica]|uniref:Putative NADH-flavin reductase n=1 Tax=Litorivivens lipolytica TaxID=1524264 RepID=A0A7W4W684_9GAMM|nr:NAD(P)H-binding protein [Litorivivens lipolytica]MBB3048190.1 putative NADH-flavin reductase [Litorivivens lipolytica]
MKVTLFGATGNVGKECLKQCLESGHEVTVLVRTPAKLPEEYRSKITVIEGDALTHSDVLSAISQGTDAVLFAIGVDEKTSPKDLCTDATQHILDVMRENAVSRLVWCGGGSNIVPADQVSFGAKFVRWYAEHFLKHRHFDKEKQLELLNSRKDISWVGVRPLQMKAGPKTMKYRIGYDKFSAMSNISFADCAHSMLQQLSSDHWVHEVPIIQY